jgi:peptidoglycan/xylan/chitin deacetylase (PgdA/CDA1 family)
MTKLITTSWDDGYPQDLKLAELLSKYNLAGTFYIPKTNQEHSVMDEDLLCQLSKTFEIGGHTLNHIRLYKELPADVLNSEVEGCYTWLENLLGYKPSSFCFPAGILNKAAIQAAYDAGFKVLRTTELLSTSFASAHNLVPTTIQVFDHSRADYLKNTLKRSQYGNLMSWLQSGSSDNTLKLVDYYLEKVENNGGCFHLWGHSWEIEEFKLWDKLEVIFKRLSGINGFKYVQNKDVAS